MVRDTVIPSRDPRTVVVTPERLLFYFFTAGSGAVGEPPKLCVKRRTARRDAAWMDRAPFQMTHRTGTLLSRDTRFPMWITNIMWIAWVCLCCLIDLSGEKELFFWFNLSVLGSFWEQKCKRGFFNDKISKSTRICILFFHIHVIFLCVVLLNFITLLKS